MIAICYRLPVILRLRFAGLIALMFAGSFLFAQSEEVHPAFSRLNSFGVSGEYSNSSSHILLGGAQQRKLLTFGASYGRRILLRPLVDLQYLAEVRPLMFESDPVVHETVTSTFSNTGTHVSQFTYRQVMRCRSGLLFSDSGKFPDGVSYTSMGTATCGRQWTFGEGLSPAGLKLNLLPRRSVQPVLSALIGYMFSAQHIPIDSGGSFNYTFELGAGVEFYRSRERANGAFGNRSIRAEYRYHHISNKYTADSNPGIDSGLVQITYAFGR